MQKKGIQRLFDRDDGLLRKALLTFLIRVGGAAAAFGMNIAIARLLGVTDAGVFFLSLTIVTAASVIACFGMDNTLMRFVSPAWVQGEHARVLGISLQGLGFAGGVSAVVTCLLYLVADLLAIRVFDEPGLSDTLRLMAFAVLPISFTLVLSGILKAVSLPAHANLIQAGVVPMVAGSTMGVFLLVHNSTSSETAAGVYVGAALFGALLGSAFLLRRIPLAKPATVAFGKLFDSSYPLLWVAILNFVIQWSSSLFLGAYADAESVGFYNVAHRTATLIAFVLVVFTSITAPRFAALYSQKRMDELEHLMTRSTWLMTLVTLPFLLATLMVPGLVLSVFGPEYESAGALLAIIAIGQFFNVITGSVGSLLVMTGHERLMRNNVLFVAVLSLVLNVVLVSRYGALGAAVSTAACLAIQNLVSAWFVQQRLGIRTILFWKSSPRSTIV